MSVTNKIAAQPLTFVSIDRIESKNAFFANQVPDVTPTNEPSLTPITVNGVCIETDQVLTEAQHHPSDSAEAALAQAARALVIRELLRQEANRLEMIVEPEIDNGGRMETIEDAMIRVLIEQQVTVPEASTEDCKRYYQNHPGKFSSDTLYEVNHILLSAAADDKVKRKSQKVLAESIIERLETRPSEFGDLAKTYSDCPSREQGGNLGQISKGATVREFEQALVTAPIGVVARTPIASRYGYHIVKVVKRVPGAVLPFSVVSEKIAAWLEASSWSRAVCQYVTLLAGQADLQGIDINSVDSPLVQ